MLSGKFPAVKLTSVGSEKRNVEYNLAITLVKILKLWNSFLVSVDIFKTYLQKKKQAQKLII